MNHGEVCLASSHARGSLGETLTMLPGGNDVITDYAHKITKAKAFENSLRIGLFGVTVVTFVGLLKLNLQVLAVEAKLIDWEGRLIMHWETAGNYFIALSFMSSCLHPRSFQAIMSRSHVHISLWGTKPH